jgi:hypothetical protein
MEKLHVNGNAKVSGTVVVDGDICGNDVSFNNLWVNGKNILLEITDLSSGIANNATDITTKQNKLTNAVDICCNDISCNGSLNVGSIVCTGQVDFTGEVTAPTVAGGANSNNTSVATTAFVTDAITNLIGSAPGSLNTLNKLAAAINDNPSYATTITTSLANKANTNNPSFTGTINSGAITATGDIRTNKIGILDNNFTVASYLDIGGSSGGKGSKIWPNTLTPTTANMWNHTDYHVWLRSVQQPSVANGGNMRIGFGNGHTDVVSSFPLYGPAAYIGCHMGGAGQDWFNGSASGGDLVFGAASSANVQSGTPERMRIRGDGNVGIGVLIPLQKLHVEGNVRADNFYMDNYLNHTNSASSAKIGFETNDTFIIITNDDVRMRVEANGCVGINCTPQSIYKLDVNGSVRVMGAITATGAITASGDITASGNITAYFSSDRRLKENIIPITNPLEKLKEINGYTFDWIENKDVHSCTGKDVGVIAQEIEAILPEVTITRDNGYKAVRYEKIVPFLISCVKEQQAQMATYEAQMATYEAQMATYEAQMATQQEQMATQQEQIDELKALVKSLME